ncbi:MAG: phosphatase PAP2 family protein [Candidatus Liptonbacteria bacterium]|nr:phosphatase PAP2 family protein [Candidatus Liptonbacteria bacterium]
MAGINETLAQWFFSLAHIHPLLDAVIVFLARQLPYLLVIGAVLFILTERRRRHRIFLFLEVALALLLSRGLLTEGIRFFHHAQRPFEVWLATPLVNETLGNSFPSGHASFYFALATILLFKNRPWGLTFGVLALINGMARIASGVHWPGDVLAGAFIGIGCALIVRLLLARTSKALRIETAPVPPPREAPSAETGADAA